MSTLTTHTRRETLDLSIFTKLGSTHEEPSPDSPNSLFDEDIPSAVGPPVSTTAAPFIPGLVLSPTHLIPEALANEVVHFCLESYFQREGVNQIMLFGTSASATGFPPLLTTLLATMASLLAPTLSEETHQLLFPHSPSLTRQAILNLYHPGEGITPHVDLLRRFGDGIVGASFGSGSVMRFAAAAEGTGYTDTVEDDSVQPVHLYLPERSMLVLTGEARYRWTHGIERRTADLVDGVRRERGTRLSITFRWMLPNADVVGDA
ncbi:unnamed protein product [Mycena citricolor]|uniref:Fe2OG dioxygenase domain-containing protein n=2 Tax=Mycena citricolor TaxID=2018698 RepID=A0AAD2H871_9AGAR|nr:unnamed protein product [Mycena citricolor]